MSNRNRDDREQEERQQAQHNRQQAWSQQQGQYGRPRGNEADDRDVQGNFSSGGHASQSYGANRDYGPSRGAIGGSAYESAYGSRGPESQGYGQQGYGSQASQGYGPQSYGAPSTGAGSQGFGPEGYGTSMYEGRGGYESQSFGSQGYGQGGSVRESGSQAPYRQYGSQSHDTSGRDIGASGFGAQRHLQGERYGSEFGHESQQWGGQQWRNPLEERSHLGYTPSSHGGQSLSSQQNLYGQQGQQGFESGLRTSHRGLGPKNYTRSDERIREDLNERLTDADDIDARGLTVEVNNGIATLTGTVEQRWMKHRAEDLAESCSGVRDVNNQIRVQALHQDTLQKDMQQKDALQKDMGSASQGSTKSGSSLGSGISGSATASTQAGTAGSTTSTGASSARPGGSAGH